MTHHAIAGRKKLMFAEGSTGFGGSGTFLRYLIPSLDQDRYEMSIATYLDASGYPSVGEMKALGIRYLPLSDRRFAPQPWAVPPATRHRNRRARKLALALSCAYFGMIQIGYFVCLWCVEMGANCRSHPEQLRRGARSAEDVRLTA
jgi:hypothetical protein